MDESKLFLGLLFEKFAINTLAKFEELEVITDEEIEQEKEIT